MGVIVSEYLYKGKWYSASEIKSIASKMGKSPNDIIESRRTKSDAEGGVSESSSNVVSSSKRQSEPTQPAKSTQPIQPNATALPQEENIDLVSTLNKMGGLQAVPKTSRSVSMNPAVGSGVPIKSKGRLFDPIGIGSDIDKLEYGIYKEKIKNLTPTEIDAEYERIKQGINEMPKFQQIIENNKLETTTIAKSKKYLDGIRNGDGIGASDAAYLQNVAPKAVEEIKKSNASKDILESSNKIKEAYKLQKEAIYREEAQGALANVSRVIPLNEIGKFDVVDKFAKEKLDAEFNRQISELDSRVVKDIDYGSTMTDYGLETDVRRNPVYYNELNKINQQKSIYREQLSQAYLTKAIQDAKANGENVNDSKVIDKLRDNALKILDPDAYSRKEKLLKPTISPLYVGAMISPMLSRIPIPFTKQAGDQSVLDPYNLKLDNMYSNALRTTGNTADADMANYLRETAVSKYPSEIRQELFARLGAEREKLADKNTSILSKANRAAFGNSYNVAVLDESAKQLPENLKNLWFNSERKVYIEQVNGADIPEWLIKYTSIGKLLASSLDVTRSEIPNKGIYPAFSQGVTEIASSTAKGLGDFTGLRTETDQIAQSFDDDIAKAKDAEIGQFKAIENRVKELSDISKKRKLTKTEVDEYEKIKTYGDLRNPIMTNIEGASKTLGNVIGIALITELGGSALNATGLVGASTAGLEGTALLEGIASNTMRANTIAGNVVGFGTAWDDAKVEAIKLFPDNQAKQYGYATLVSTVTSLSENIFRDAKLLENVKPNILKLAEKIGTGQINRSLFNSELRNAIKPFAGEFIKSSGQEGFEEAITRLSNTAGKILFGAENVDYSQEAREVASTFGQTVATGWMVSSMSGYKSYKDSKLSIGTLSQIGRDVNVANDVINTVNRLYDNGDISEKEKFEKLKVVRTLQDVHRNVISQTKGTDLKLTDKDEDKLALVITNKRILNEKLKNASDDFTKKVLQKQINQANELEDNLLSGKYTVDENYNVVNVEERSNQIAQATPKTEEEKLQSLNTDGMQPSIQDNGQIVTTQASGATTTTPTKTINGTGTYEFEGKLYIQGKDGIVTYENGNLPPTAEQEKVKKEGIFTPITPISNEQAQSPNIQVPSTEGTAVNGQGEVTAQPQEVLLPTGNTTQIETKPLIEVPTSTKSDLAKLASDNKEVFGDFMPTPRADGSYSPVDFKRAKALVEKYNEETQISNNAITQQNTKQNGKSNQEAINAKAEGQGQNDVVGNQVGVASTNKGTSTTAKSKEKLPISSKVGEAVTVNIGGKAISGIVESDEGGKLTLSSGNKIIELSNDQQYVDYASPVRLADNQDGIEVNGEVYTEVRFDISNGKEVAVLIKEDGSITTNSNPQIIEELKYQSALAMLDEMSEQEAQKLKQRYESKRTTEKPTKEGTNQTDGATQQKSEEEIKLQEAIDEIGLIEQIALDDLENNDKKARLIEHENGKTYLVEKNKDGSYTATLNGRKVRKGNHLDSLIEMYKTQSKKESDELIPKLQKQVDDLKQEVLNKLYNKQKTQEDATKESNKQQEVGTESNISQREGTVQGQQEDGQGKGEQRSTENKGADNSNSNQPSEGQKEVKAESNPALRDVESTAKEQMSDNELQQVVGMDVFKQIQRSEEELGEGVIDRNRMIETAKQIQKSDKKEKLLPEHIFEALQYEMGYPDNWQDLRNAIKKGGIDINSESVQRQIEVGVDLPKDIIEEFKKSERYKNANPELVKAVESLLSKEQTPKLKSKATPLQKEQESKPITVQEAAKYEPEVIEEEQYEPITVGDTSHNSFTKDNSVDYEEDEKEGDNGRTYTYLSSITVELVDDFSGETIGRITKLKDEDGEITWRSEDIDGNEIDDNLSSKYEAQKSIVDKWNKEQEKEFKKEKAKAAKEKAKEAEKARKKLEKEAAKAAKATTASAEVVSAAQRVQQALEATGITVEVIDNDQDFQDKLDAEGVKRDGSDGASGVFISKSGKIFINASKVDDTWGSVDVWHEGTHPIINIIRNTNPKLYKSIIEGLNELVASNPEIAAVVDWAQSNYEGENTLEDETITETIARIANGNIDLSKIPTSLKDRIVDFINKIAKSLGIDPILKNSSIAEFKKIATEISEALREGKDISSIVGIENVKSFENKISELIGNGIQGENILEANINPNYAQARVKAKANVYKSEKTVVLPVVPMKDILKKFKGKVTAINSDPTRVGELTLMSGKKIFLYGGVDYVSLKKNNDNGIGFATTLLSKVDSYTKLLKKFFGNNDGVTLIVSQTPLSLLSNSYSMRYVLDAISQLPASVRRNVDFKKEFFGKDIVALKNALGEKTYNDFLNKYEDLDLGDDAIINKMVEELAYKISEDNSPASFRARGVFVSNLLAGINLKSNQASTKNEEGYYSVKPSKFISGELMSRFGLNAEKLFYEIGDKEIVDLYMKKGIWGVTKAGFESNANADYKSIQGKGVSHPLFNSKFASSKSFNLDGIYKIDDLLEPEVMTESQKGVPYIDKKTGKSKPYIKKSSLMLAASIYTGGIVKGTPSAVQFSKGSRGRKAFDETGFISTSNMIDIVASNNPDYLGDVMQHIIEMGDKLKRGAVTTSDLSKAYMMAVSSILSGDINADTFEKNIGEKVDPAFLEPNRKIRTEGAMAYLLTTDRGNDFLKHIKSGKITEEDKKFISNSMKPFGMFGEGQSKYESLFGAADKNQINLTNINEFKELLKNGVSSTDELFDKIKRLKQISQGKVGFIANFLGIGERGVIDTREIKGWLRGSIFKDELTERELSIKNELTKSLKNLTPLQKEILSRMRDVGRAMGIDESLAEYIGHHMIWDAVAKERTTHDGLYLAMKQNRQEFDSRLRELSQKSNPQFSKGNRKELSKPINWEKSKEGKGDPSISSRNPIVQEAAKNLKEGKITNEEYRATVSENSPIGAITRFFEPATLKRVKESISVNVDKINSRIKEGTRVALRLDIPAYKNKNTWVVSVHDGNLTGGKIMSYTNVAKIKNVVFKTESTLGALNIATAKEKQTIARMFGDWEEIKGSTFEQRGENAKKMIEDIVNDPSYVQVGMNPFRHSYFYDRSSDIGRPIKSADEVIQVGGLVYAKNPIYGNWTDEAYRVKGLLDANQNPVQFSKGNRDENSGGQIRLFGMKEFLDNTPMNAVSKKVMQFIIKAFPRIAGITNIVKDQARWDKELDAHNADPKNVDNQLDKDDYNGFYATNNDGTITILLHPTKSNNETIIHEIIHAFTQAILDNPTNAKERIYVKRLQALYKKFQSIKGAKQNFDYQFNDISEFMVSAMTNTDFQNFLNKNEATKTAWQKVKDFIANIFGIPTTMVDKVIGSTQKIISVTDYKNLQDRISGVDTQEQKEAKSYKKVTNKINELLSHLGGVYSGFKNIKLSFGLRKGNIGELTNNDRTKLFKKAFGETTAKLIRSNMSFGFEQPEKLIEFLKNKIPNKADMPFLIKEMAIDLEKEFLSNTDNNKLENQVGNPKDLLQQVGYTFFEPLKNLEEAQPFRAYYEGKGSDMREGGSIICTYKDPSRPKENFIMFVVKDDANETLRPSQLTQENLSEAWKKYLTEKGKLKEDGTFDLSNLRAEREDPFSTSVLSIQVNKRNGSLKIISRYNHDLASSNPDITFNGKLNKLVEGLEDAIYSHVGVQKSKNNNKIELPANVTTDSKGRLFVYGREEYGVYYGDGFFIKNGDAVMLDPNTERMANGYIYSTNGKITPILNILSSPFGNYQKITFLANNAIRIETDNGNIEFAIKNGIAQQNTFIDKSLVLNYFERTQSSTGKYSVSKEGKITLASVENKDILFWHNDIIEVKGDVIVQRTANLDAKNLQSVGGDVLVKGTANLDANNLQSIGGGVFVDDTANLDAKNLQSVDGDVNVSDTGNLDANNLQIVGGDVFVNSTGNLYANNLQSVGDNVHVYGTLDAKNLQSVGGDVRVNSTGNLYANNLQSIGGNVRVSGTGNLYANNLQSIGYDVRVYGAGNLDANNLQSVGGDVRVDGTANLDALQSIGGSIRVEGKANLDALQSVGGGVIVYGTVLDANLKENDPKNNAKEITNNISKIFKDAHFDFIRLVSKGKSLSDLLPKEYQLDKSKSNLSKGQKYNIDDLFGGISGDFQGQPLFQISSEADQAEFFTNDKTPATKEKIQAKFKDAEVVQSESDLPKEVQDEIKAQKADGRIKGVYYNGRVILIADNIKVMGEAIGTYRHEMLGHKGVIERLGTKLNKFATDIVNNAKTVQLKKLEQLSQLYFGKPISELNAKEKSGLGQEYISFIAENRGKYPSTWQKIVDFVKQTLRSLGIPLNVSDKEIISLIGKVERTKNESKVENKDNIRFSIDRNDTDTPFTQQDIQDLEDVVADIESGNSTIEDYNDILDDKSLEYIKSKIEPTEAKGIETPLEKASRESKTLYSLISLADKTNKTESEFIEENKGKADSETIRVAYVVSKRNTIQDKKIVESAIAYKEAIDKALSNETKKETKKAKEIAKKIQENKESFENVKNFIDGKLSNGISADVIMADVRVFQNGNEELIKLAEEYLKENATNENANKRIKETEAFVRDLLALDSTTILNRTYLKLSEGDLKKFFEELTKQGKGIFPKMSVSKINELAESIVNSTTDTEALLLRVKSDFQNQEIQPILLAKVIRKLDEQGKFELAANAMADLFDLSNQAGRRLKLFETVNKIIGNRVSTEYKVAVAKKVSEKFNEVKNKAIQEAENRLSDAHKKEIERLNNEINDIVSNKIENKVSSLGKKAISLIEKLCKLRKK
jgi:hypothetical protein